MKNQVWFQTDLGYETTIEQLRRSGMFTGQGYLGRHTFHLKASKDVTFQITVRGKVGIFYPKEISVKECRERITPFLVRADGRPARIIKEIYSSERANARLGFLKSSPGRSEPRADRKWSEERDLQFLDAGYIKILRSMKDHAPNEDHREYIEKMIKRTFDSWKDLEALREKS